MELITSKAEERVGKQGLGSIRLQIISMAKVKKFDSLNKGC
jgi:hypothetical protein